MAIQSVIEIKVDTSEFDAFEQRLAALQNYSVNLGVSAGGISAGGSTANPMAGQLKAAAQTQQMNRLAQVNTLNQGVWAKNILAAQDSWSQGKLQKNMQTFNVDLEKAGKSLGRFGTGLFNFSTMLLTGATKLTKVILGTGGLLSGLTAVSAFMGMLRNAQVINQRAFAGSAVGVGANTLPSLESTYGRFGDVQSQMGGIATELANPASPVAAQLGGMMGVPPDILRKMDPVERYKQIIDFLQKNRNNPLFQSQEFINQLGLGNVVSAEQQRRFQFYGQEGYQSALGIESRYAPYMNLSKQRQIEIQNFEAERRKQGLGVSNVFSDVMAPVRQGTLDVFRNLLEKALGPSGQGGWMRGGLDRAAESVGRGLERLAEFLATGDWNALWADAKKAALAYWNEEIVPMAKSAWDDIKGYFSKEVAPFLNEQWNSFKQANMETVLVFQSLREAMTSVIDLFKGLYSTLGVIKDAFGLDSEGMSQLYDAIKAAKGIASQGLGWQMLFPKTDRELAPDTGEIINEWIRNSIDTLKNDIYGLGMARKSSFRSSAYPEAGGSGWQSGSGSYGPGMGTPTIVVRTRQDPANNTGLQYIMTYGAAYNAWPRTS